MSKHRGPGRTRRILCALGLHDYGSTEVEGEPYTYRCRYCPINALEGL